jgi:hypothetical protein
MAEGEVRQYFIRNDKGTLWGPLTLATIELLIDNGVIQGRLQVSEDGLNFAFPGRFPHIRDAFPREMWGDVIAAGATVQVAKTELPPEMLGQPAPSPGAPTPMVPGMTPTAGPGAVAQVAAPRAGPGAMAQAALRQGAGAMPQAGVPRPGPGAAPQAAAPMAGPGARAAAAPPGPMPGSPSGTFRAAPPPGAAPRPPPVVTPAAPPAPSAAPAPVPAATPAAAAPTATPAASAGGMEPSTPAPPSQGTLEQHSPVALYGRIAAGGLTGLLTLTLADRSVQIHFRKGNPEFVDSSHPEDALGTLLLQAKLISAEQLQQAEGGRARFGGDLLAALFGMGLLQPATAFSHLSQRALSILHKGLRAESGTFTYEAKELPAAKAMPIGNRWAVLSDQVRRLPSPDLKRRLQPVLNLPIMKSGGLVATSDLRLTPHEVRVLTVIDGVRSLAQLLADFPQDHEHILRLAFLLKELDAVSFAAVPQRAPEPKAAAPKPAAPNPPPAAAPKPAAPNPPPAAAPRPAAPNPPPAAAAAPGAPVLKPSAPAPSAPTAAPGAPVLKPSAPAPSAPSAAPGAPVLKPSAPAPSAPSAAPGAPVLKPSAPAPSAPTAAAGAATGPGAEEIPALRQTAATMKGQNLFQRLGLAEQADAGAAKVAYFKLARLYHPDTLPPGAPQELEKLKAEIFGYIGDAYRTLTDEKARKEYIEQLKSGDTGKEEVDVVAILQSEERFKRGTVFMKARKYAEAVKIFEEAIQLNAEEPEFHAWRAYARFCAAPDKKAAQPEAFRDLQAAIKKNERCVPAHYFLGVIAKTLGDATGALKHFRKTVELQPDHIDAQREIRMATQKK